jgi:hypothetical protein
MKNMINVTHCGEKLDKKLSLFSDCSYGGDPHDWEKIQQDKYQCRVCRCIGKKLPFGMIPIDWVQCNRRDFITYLDEQ